jgi:hypothetical protein
MECAYYMNTCALSKRKRLGVLHEHVHDVALGAEEEATTVVTVSRQSDMSEPWRLTRPLRERCRSALRQTRLPMSGNRWGLEDRSRWRSVKRRGDGETLRKNLKSETLI